MPWPKVGGDEELEVCHAKSDVPGVGTSDVSTEAEAFSEHESEECGDAPHLEEADFESAGQREAPPRHSTERGHAALTTERGSIAAGEADVVAAPPDVATPANAELLCYDVAAVEDTQVQAQDMPGFSGKWVMRGYEGDFEALMEAGGTSWATRKLARAGNYGVGVVTQVIKQEGDTLLVDFQAGLSSNKQTLKVDGSEQDTVGEKGERVRVTATWDGQRVTVQGIYRKTGAPCMRMQRYLVGDSMVVETFLPNGTSVKRVFRK